MICARKPGKLPGDIIKQSYELEYGENTISIQKKALNKYTSSIVDFLTGKISAWRLETDKKERIKNIDAFLIEMINNDFCEYIYDF